MLMQIVVFQMARLMLPQVSLRQQALLQLVCMRKLSLLQVKLHCQVLRSVIMQQLPKIQRWQLVLTIVRLVLVLLLSVNHQVQPTIMRLL